MINEITRSSLAREFESIKNMRCMDESGHYSSLYMDWLVYLLNEGKKKIEVLESPKHETVEELRLVTIAKLVNEFNKRLESSCCNEITCNECNLRECPVGIVKDVLNEHGKPEIEG